MTASLFGKRNAFLYFLVKNNGQIFPRDSLVKSLPTNSGNMGSSPDLGRSHMPAEQLSPSQFLSLCSRAYGSQLLRLALEHLFSNKRGDSNEKPAYHNQRVAFTGHSWRKACAATKDLTQSKINMLINKKKNNFLLLVSLVFEPIYYLCLHFLI